MTPNSQKKWWFAVLQVAVSSWLFFSGTANSSNSSNFLLFQTDSSFDNVKVTTDADSLDLSVSTVTGCTLWCQKHAWCSSFFYTASSGDSSLHAIGFLDPGIAAASSGTRYFRNVVDWCQPLQARLYHRLTETCVYFELDSSKFARWSDTDSACVSMGMRLASNISPIKMDALMVMTKKNRPALSGDVMFGLTRKVSTTFEWLDGQIMDNTVMQRFWAPSQPNGLTYDQDCVGISPDDDEYWNDRDCALKFSFVCELLKPIQ